VKIDAGALDRRLTIRKEFTATDDYGQTTKTFADVTTVWAERLELRTVDTARAGARDSYTTARFLIRYRVDVTTDCRIVVDGVVYDVVAVDPQGRRESMILTGEEAKRD
jgi:SPP1 family predicted phage head-tail adaptor